LCTGQLGVNKAAPPSPLVLPRSRRRTSRWQLLGLNFGTGGSKSDQSQADAQDGNAPTGPEPVRNEMMNLTLTGGVTHASQVKLSCQNLGGGNTFLKFIKITAIKVGKIHKSTF
jgi:hypothetical protein